MDSSDALIARFLALHPKTIDLSLERIARLLADLGHPERRLPPVIHVAGTNGKGSTVAFLRAKLITLLDLLRRPTPAAEVVTLPGTPVEAETAAPPAAKEPREAPAGEPA